MTRVQFLAELRQGLSGLPRGQIDDMVADYDTHFADAAAAGRSEGEVAASLGDPARLAKELRAEASIQRWENSKTPKNFVSAGMALAGLVAFDFFIILPLLFVLLLVVGICIFVLGILASVGFGLAGSFFHGFGIGGLAVSMVGLAMLSGVVGAGALVFLLLGWGLRLAARYARLHYRLLDKDDAARMGEMK